MQRGSIIASGAAIASSVPSDDVYSWQRVYTDAPMWSQVTGWINLKGILPPQDYNDLTDVLNGIAYDAKGDRLFVTGKRWPKLFEIKLKKLP